MIADISRGVDGFVREYRHEGFGVSGTDRLEGFDDARIDIGEIKLVDAVVVKEEGNHFGYVLLIMNVPFGVAESAANEQGSAVADIAGDDGLREFRLAEVGEGGIDGVAKVDAGVNEGAVEIEDDEAWWRDERMHFSHINRLARCMLHPIERTMEVRLGRSVD